MKPIMMYRLGRLLKVEYLTEPLRYAITIEDKTLTIEPGKFYDLVRILNSYLARHQIALGTMNKEPIGYTGERTGKNAYFRKVAEDRNQLALFPEVETKTDVSEEPEVPLDKTEVLQKIQELRKEIVKLEKVLKSESIFPIDR